MMKYFSFVQSLQDLVEAVYALPLATIELSSLPRDHDSIFHVTETPVLITRPSVTSLLEVNAK